MTDTEKKIAEIREALEKATPGTWKWIDPGGYERKKLVGEYEIMNFGASMPYSEVAGQEPDDADAHLIANAPEWLRFLLSELERLEHEYALERAAHNAHVTELCELEQERDRLFERLKNITITLGGVTFTDGRQRGAYNALCDIVKDWQK